MIQGIEKERQQAQENKSCDTQSMHSLKDFNGCGIEEKVSRIHTTVKDLCRELHNLYQSNKAMVNKLYALEHHQHSEKGDCMIKIEDANRNTGSSVTGGISNSNDLLA